MLVSDASASEPLFPHPPFARSLPSQGCVGLLPSPARGHAAVTWASLVRIFVYLYSIGVGQALFLCCFVLAGASEFRRVKSACGLA